MGDARPAPAGLAGWTLGEAKIQPPRRPPGDLVRERLLARLTRCAEALFTIVCGGAGSGKTTLLASWAESGLAPGPVGWVSLDADDDVPPLFWGWVAAALHRAAGLELGDEVTPSSIALAVSERELPVVLVLDDFHLLHSGELLAEVRSLLRHAPPQLRLVIGTRETPRLGLPRMRLDGTARELGPHDLAFSETEAAELLGEAPEVSEALWRRTEGWAAGLRLAAMALEREHDATRFVEGFSGADRDVTDYLRHEVLEALDPAAQDFLLRTSLPEALTAELAAALTGRGDAAALLDELERAIAFVTHSGRPPVVRYHALFREFLAGELHRRLPDDVRELHETAAHWLRANGEPIAALRHAFAARDWPLGAELVVESWPYIATTPPLLYELADAELPAALDEPELALLAAGTCLFRGEPEPADALLERAVATFERMGPERAERGTPLVDAVRLFRAQLVGDLDGVTAGAKALLAVQPTARPGQRTRVRAIALANLGIADAHRGRLEDARETLALALEAARECGAVLTEQNALGYLALVAAGRGRLRVAADRATEAIDSAREHGIQRTPQAFSAQLTIGLVRYLWDDLDAAGRHVERARDLARRAANQRARVLTGLLAARVLSARDPGRADAALRDVRGLADARAAIELAPCFAWLEVGAEARLVLARGDDPDSALAVLTGDGPEAAVARARLELADGRPAEALAALEGANRASEAHPVVAIEALVLEALAREQLHEREEPHAALERALELAAPEEYRRVFVEGGPPLASLLREHVRRGTRPRAFVDDLLAAFDRRGAAVPITRHELLEPLSDRERAVLGYLPTMLSNQEIAEAMYVSKNTVKTHLRNLYRKLGASGRRDAVERARRMGLL